VREGGEMMISPEKEVENDMNKVIDYKYDFVEFIIYKLSIYKLLPWEYGGRVLFQWPTRRWIRNKREEE
jgi:hypothetical protein